MARDVPVWDIAVRWMHWTLVASVAVSAVGLWWWVGMHRPAGYVALAIVMLRIVWGFVGSRHARFSRFMTSAPATARYGLAVLSGREVRHLGHNPLGAWMIIALMCCVVGLAVSGWLYTSDWFWGDERVERVHTLLAWTLLWLVCLHVAGVVFTSFRHRENLVRSMLDGRKRAASGNDVA